MITNYQHDRQVWTSTSGRSRVLEYSDGTGSLWLPLEPCVTSRPVYAFGVDSSGFPVGEPVSQTQSLSELPAPAELQEALAWCEGAGWQVMHDYADDYGAELRIDLARPGMAN